MQSDAYTMALDFVDDPVVILEHSGDSFLCRYANRSARACFDPHRRNTESPGHDLTLEQLISEDEPRRIIKGILERALAGDVVAEELNCPLAGPNGTVLFRARLAAEERIILTGKLSADQYMRRDTETPDYHDATTGLPNRHALREIAGKELARAQRESEPMALLFVMLHNFKEINQHHGHHVGDLLLENTGVRAREVIRRSDYVFRWEGTNLVVLLPHLATSLDVAIVAEKLFEEITLPYRFREINIAPGCHIGVALYPDDGETYDDLVNCANSAVIEAERRKAPFLLYDSKLHDRAVDRLSIRSGIQRAFERGEFEVYYQPILHPDGRIAGAEALMRWNHSERGLLSPESFIEIAEESHLITLIDKVALFSVCRTLAEWHDVPEIFVSVNISARDLASDELTQVMQQALADYHLDDAGRIKLEITESRLIERSTVSHTVVADLQAMGIETWIDDFGTGQSSLTYLKHLPVTTVKIDQEFIRDISGSPDDLAYFRSIVDTVRSRGKSVIVEGIATSEQHQIVANLPVAYLQGFYFAGPMRAEEFRQLLDSTSVLPLH